MTTVATAVGGIGGNGPGSLTERQVLLGKREELLRTDGASGVASENRAKSNDVFQYQQAERDYFYMACFLTGAAYA